MTFDFFPHVKFGLFLQAGFQCAQWHIINALLIFLKFPNNQDRLNFFKG